METLKFLLQSKKADPDTARDVVRGAAEWMHIQFMNGGIPHEYADGGSGLGCFSHFQIKTRLGKTAITLHLKIAEIKGSPYAFSEVRVTDHQETVLFPFFGEIGSSTGKETILHYIADFILSTMPEVAEQ